MYQPHDFPVSGKRTRNLWPPRGVHFIAAYFLALLLAGGPLIIAPPWAIMAMLSFPLGLFRHKYVFVSMEPGVVLQLTGAYVAYLGVYMLWCRYRKVFLFLIFMGMLCVNVVGCHLQHADFNSQF